MSTPESPRAEGEPDKPRELAANTVCPKCGAPRDPVACPRCGLRAEHMAAYRRSQEDIPEALEAAWQRTLDAWSDLTCHEEVMRLVTQHDAYAWAAAQYRRRPADTIRDRQLERVRKASEAPMMIAAFAKNTKTKTPYKAHMVLLVLLVLAAFAALLFTAILPKGDEGEPLPPAPTRGGAR